MFLDDVLVARFIGNPSGTVSVYPALGSEIFVTEIAVEGELDPEQVVIGPTGLRR